MKAKLTCIIVSAIMALMTISCSNYSKTEKRYNESTYKMTAFSLKKDCSIFTDESSTTLFIESITMDINNNGELEPLIDNKSIINISPLLHNTFSVFIKDLYNAKGNFKKEILASNKPKNNMSNIELVSRVFGKPLKIKSWTEFICEGTLSDFNEIKMFEINPAVKRLINQHAIYFVNKRGNNKYVLFNNSIYNVERLLAYSISIEKNQLNKPCLKIHFYHNQTHSVLLFQNIEEIIKFIEIYEGNGRRI